MPRILVRGAQIDIQMILDTGASCNLMSERTMKEIQHPLVTKGVNEIIPTNSSKQIMAYQSDTVLTVIGKFVSKIYCKGKAATGTFYVVKLQGSSLFLNLYCTEHGVLSIIHTTKIKPQTNTSDPITDFITHYHQITNGIGKYRGNEIKLHIDESVKPVMQTHRRVLYLRNKLATELNDLLLEDIIEAVEGPTPLVRPIVVTPKPHSPNEVTMCGCVSIREVPTKPYYENDTYHQQLMTSLVPYTAAQSSQRLTCVKDITNYPWPM